jgi:hypothetical protein
MGRSADLPRCVGGGQCFFHERIRRERAKIAADASAQRRFDLPLLEDANSVQVALMKTIQMLGSGRLDHRTAGLMLYALQTASVNLRNAEFEARRATDVVIDRDDVDRTCINGPQWYEEDFDEEVEEEGEAEVEDEADSEAAIPAAQVAAAAVPAAPRKAVKQVSLEEARTRVQGAIRNWLLENGREKAAAKPD